VVAEAIAALRRFEMSRFGSRLLDALLSLVSIFPAFATDGDNGSILDPDG
jgi:hypothetical protein